MVSLLTSLPTRHVTTERPSPRQRTAVLDQFRACAILLVVVFHTVQMSSVPLPGLARITSYGQHGVDLFFVLSGWLIGGLYWREMNISGRVDILRFWLRRWMRTLPPYFVTLLFSWLAVRWTRGEAFDLGYLVFLQNYYTNIPFFLVSWSLCIEEHFYLAAPLLAALLCIVMPRNALWLGWVLAMIVSPYCRWLQWQQVANGDFGYYDTATHLRLDGLVLGFGLSYVATFAALTFKQLVRWALVISPSCIVGLAVLEWVGGSWRYVLWPEAIALLCASFIVIGVSREALKYPATPKANILPYTNIAIASYSAYLVHPLAIHAARSAVAAVGAYQLLLYWPVAIALIVTATVIFYMLIERPSILIRDVLVPSRASERKTGLVARFSQIEG